MTEEQLAIAKIFLPHATREMARVREKSIRFAHYTSAKTGIDVLRSERIFLRNSLLMNDFSEVRHGWECLKQAYNSPLGARLQVVMRLAQENLPEILQGKFNSQIIDVMNETYLASVSEHGDEGGDEHEDKFGSLSMWRAYAAKDGVAFIMNHAPFLGESDALGAYTSPVVYATPESFKHFFDELVKSMEQNIDVLKQIGGQYVHDISISAFRFAVQSTKHPSFKEEKEWRIIYAPAIVSGVGTLTGEQKARMHTDILTLGSVPQRVYAIPFVDHPEAGFVGATVPALIDRVLVGPSRDSYAIKRAFVVELDRLDVPDAESKVVITGVPLRH